MRYLIITFLSIIILFDADATITVRGGKLRSMSSRKTGLLQQHKDDLKLDKDYCIELINITSNN